jgi:hypothetical protein
MKKVADIINHPAHYNFGTIEVISVTEDWGLGFHLGNAVKYLARAGRKPGSSAATCLGKARFYLQRAIRYYAEGGSLQLRSLHSRATIDVATILEDWDLVGTARGAALSWIYEYVANGAGVSATLRHALLSTERAIALARDQENSGEQQPTRSEQ